MIDLTIAPREKDLGGFVVRRLLPFAQRRMVGPFVFLDHMGPAHFDAGQGIDVRPHPHIGLATVTYLFSGEIFHRDSLGSAQPIQPGAVNWMTAGRGITHSERTAPDVRAQPHDVNGLQSWIALPKEYEETDPAFHHHAADTLPVFDVGDVRLKLVAGSAFGHSAPVHTFSPLFYLEAHMPAGSSLVLPADDTERAAYLITGQARIGTATILPQTMPVFTPGDSVTIEALAPSHLMLLGGEPLAEPRYLDWNFVSSSQERLEAAKADWAAGRFPTVPGDAHEFIPLPGTV
jgi:hypothetical protein